MKVLLDHNVPKRFGGRLTGHQAITARQMRWDGLDNGRLLQAASNGGFDVLLSIDKSIQFQHNLSKLPLPIVILDSRSNAMPELERFVGFVLGLLMTPLLNHIYIVRGDGTIDRLG